VTPYPVNYQTNGSRAELREIQDDASDGFGLTGLHPVLKTPSLVFLWNQEVGHGETEVHAGVQA